MKFVDGSLPDPAPAPTAGQHNDEILADVLGYDADRIAASTTPARWASSRNDRPARGRRVGPDPGGVMSEVGQGTGPDGTRGDLRWGTIPALVRDAAVVRGDAEAIVDRSATPEVRLTFAGLRSRVDAMAAALVAAGVQPGDRVAIWAPNCWEWVVALLGLQTAGAVLVPLNTRYKGVEAADILRRSRARLLFTVEGFLGNDYVSMLREAPGTPG